MSKIEPRIPRVNVGEYQFYPTPQPKPKPSWWRCECGRVYMTFWGVRTCKHRAQA